MRIPVEAAIRLVHECPYGALATQSIQIPGYPFVSILPFVPDEAHNPVFLVSALAEHTRNLLADGRVSLLLSRPDGENVQTGARVTLMGEARPLDAGPALVARYLRYQPDGERYLALGDFRFFRLAPKRLRLIAGFGQMGWIEGATWCNGPVLPLEDEARLLQRLEAGAPEGARLLGLDRLGLDLERGGRRQRLDYPGVPEGDPHALEAAAGQILAELA